MIPESRLIYWSLPGVMGHLQDITLAEYFIAPGAAANQTSDLYINPPTEYVVWKVLSVFWDQLTVENSATIYLSKSH